MELLYTTSGTANPQSTKSHAVFSFYVPKEYEKLIIDFSYSPSAITDETAKQEIVEQALMKHQADENMKRLLVEYGYEKEYPNLLTLSVDDPEGYKGAAHRFATDQKLIISEEESSPGLMCGRVHPGMWNATVSFHAVYTKECEYTLKVMGRDSIE